MQSTVDRAAAWRLLHREGWRRFLPARRSTKPEGKLPLLELAWLPRFHVIDRLQTSERSLEALVDAFDGVCAIFDSTNARWENDETRERFEPTIEPEAAGRLARAQWRQLVRGPFWRAPPTFLDPPILRLVHYPFWIYYFERRQGRLDVRALDGWTGQLAGARVKNSLLRAWTSARP